MGGFGSGNWRDRKTVVEDCLSIDANRWTRAGIIKAGIVNHGTMRWAYPNGGGFTIRFQVDTRQQTEPILRMSYDWIWRSTEQVDSVSYAVGLETTKPFLGGLRWWFICPRCKGRCGKLYLPPPARHFGCRSCHSLTYTSCQERGKYDTLYRRLATRTGTDVATIAGTLAKGIPPPQEEDAL